MNAECFVHVLQNCSSLNEATSRLMQDLGDEVNVYRQVHRMGANQGFPVHKHFTTNEWLVLFDAVIDFVIHVDGVEKVQKVRSLNKATVIHIPVGTCHTIRNRGSVIIVYAAVKDGPDDFNWC